MTCTVSWRRPHPEHPSRLRGGVKTPQTAAMPETSVVERAKVDEPCPRGISPCVGRISASASAVIAARSLPSGAWCFGGCAYPPYVLRSVCRPGNVHCGAGPRPATRCGASPCVGRISASASARIAARREGGGRFCAVTTRAAARGWRFSRNFSSSDARVRLTVPGCLYSYGRRAGEPAGYPDNQRGNYPDNYRPARAAEAGKSVMRR